MTETEHLQAIAKAVIDGGAEDAVEATQKALEANVDPLVMLNKGLMGGADEVPVAKKMLCQIIQPRMEEILTLIQKELLKSGYRDFLSAGAVITGGTALLKGIAELAEQVLRMPVRIGYPRGVNGLDDGMNNPMYATGVGLVLFGTREKKNGFNGEGGDNAFTKFSHRMQKWFEEVL